MGGLRHQEERRLSRGGAGKTRVISVTEKGREERKTLGDTVELREMERQRQNKRKGRKGNKGEREREEKM